MTTRESIKNPLQTHKRAEVQRSPLSAEGNVGPNPRLWQLLPSDHTRTAARMHTLKYLTLNYHSLLRSMWNQFSASLASVSGAEASPKAFFLSSSRSSRRSADCAPFCLLALRIKGLLLTRRWEKFDLISPIRCCKNAAHAIGKWPPLYFHTFAVFVAVLCFDVV